MKRIVLTLAFVLAPVAGLAQADVAGPPPPPDAVAPNPQMMQAMHASHAQMRQMELQARSQMLASISAPHRSQIAGLVGQFAVAPNPDRGSLERQIDAVISRGEAQSIVNVAATLHANERNLMESERAQFESSLTPDELAKMKARDAKMQAMHAEHETSAPDPARELLHAMLAGDMHGPGGHHQ